MGTAGWIGTDSRLDKEEKSAGDRRNCQKTAAEDGKRNGYKAYDGPDQGDLV